MTLALFLGGARSGKSAYAQSSAEETARTNNGRLIYIAMASHAIKRSGFAPTLIGELNKLPVKFAGGDKSIDSVPYPNVYNVHRNVCGG